ncbi:MAG TPA: PhoH family protein [Longimicrobiaceae bacterium]|jgi:phosphate starvation-inducible PhoH-like protein
MANTEVQPVQHRLSTEGADPMTIGGINDGNLTELGRLANVRVVLRGDHLVLSGGMDEVERAVPVAQHMIELARGGQRIAQDDVERFWDETTHGAGGAARLGEGGRISIPGARKTISPKSAGQREYLEAIAENDIVVGVGPAGTGKTYLAVAMAVEALAHKRVKRIILARPAVEAGENLGFLPGDLQDKVDPYLRPLYDALEDMMPADRLKRAMESRTIEIAPLAYMRGRTLQDAFVILDEAQNATGLQMKMFLTRLGLNSKAVITGDPTQVDLPRRDDSGLLQIERILKGIEGISFVYMKPTDVIRHRLVREIIRAYAAAAGEDADAPGQGG